MVAMTYLNPFRAVDVLIIMSGRKLPFVEAKGKPDFTSEKDDEVESAWLCRNAKRADVLTVSECGRAWTVRDTLSCRKTFVMNLHFVLLRPGLMRMKIANRDRQVRLGHVRWRYRCRYELMHIHSLVSAARLKIIFTFPKPRSST